MEYLQLLADSVLVEFEYNFSIWWNIQFVFEFHYIICTRTDGYGYRVVAILIKLQTFQQTLVQTCDGILQTSKFNMKNKRDNKISTCLLHYKTETQ